MPMPLRGDYTAPRWNGEASELLEFLGDVQAAGKENRLSDADMIQAALQYAPSEESRVWQDTDGSSSSSWAGFVTDVIALYPGALETFAFRALETLVSARAIKPIGAPSDLAQFYQDFRYYAAFLIIRGRLGTGERDRLFLKGFHPALRSQIIAHHSYRFPKHHPRDPYPYEEIRAVADRILTAALPEHSLTAADPTDLTAPTILRAIQLLLSALSAHIAKYTAASAAAYAAASAPARTATSAAPASGYTTAFASAYGPTPSAQQPSRSVRPPILCTFCGKKGEFIRQCPVVREYIRVGKAVQDTASGWLTIPGGGYLPYVPNGTLKDRFDAFHAAHSIASAPPFSASTSPMFRAAEVPLRPASTAFVAPTRASEAELLGVLQSYRDINAVAGEDPVLKVFEAADAGRRKEVYSDQANVPAVLMGPTAHFGDSTMPVSEPLHTTDVFMQPHLRIRHRSAPVLKRIHTAPPIPSSLAPTCRISAGCSIGNSGDPTVTCAATTHFSTMSYRLPSAYDSFDSASSSKLASLVRISHLPSHCATVLSVVESSHPLPLVKHPARFDSGLHPGPRLASRKIPTQWICVPEQQATSSNVRQLASYRSDQGWSGFFVPQ